MPIRYEDVDDQLRRIVLSGRLDTAGSEEIAQEFQPEKIILFGSHSDGNAEPDSDVDLLVIFPIERSSFWKSLEILNRVNARYSLDLLARRPDDTARRYREGDPLIRAALDHGRVLYERCRQRVDRQGGRRFWHG